MRYWGYSYQYAPDMLPFLIELAWAFGILGTIIVLVYPVLFPGTRITTKKPDKIYCDRYQRRNYR